MRLFIGVAFDEQVKAGLAGICDGLRELGCRGGYTPAANLHLTLKFLGETDRARLPMLRSAVNAACRGVGSFKLQTGTLGSFGSGGERLIWLGITQSEPLQMLVEKLEEHLSAAGFAKESRAFKPHLTLVRRALITHADLKDAQPPQIVLPVNEVTLFESTRANGMLEYLPVYIAKL